MRRTRRLLLFVFLAVLIFVGATYYYQTRARARVATAPPRPLPQNLTAAADYWTWSQNDGDTPQVEVRARTFRQVKEPSTFELEDVEIRFFEKDGKQFDLVRSAKASFDIAAKSLRSDGEVEITLGVPAGGPPRERLLKIKSSGVTFDSATGKATTDQPASFVFDRGEGSAVGATYDPTTRELRMHSQVRLSWRGEGPRGRTMQVEAGELTYLEDESKVFLTPWAKLTRGTMTLEGAASVVTLEEGAIRLVETQNARGSDTYPRRQIEYQAGQLTMNFSKEGEVEKIVGQSDARLVSTSDGARTTVTSERVDLDFDLSSGESALAKAVATGSGVVESVPPARPGSPRAPTRVLRSEVVHLLMRAGGREIERVETHAPGQVEFIPNRPGERRRHMDAERMWIDYGAGNQIESFRAVEVSTRSLREGLKKETPAALTWSKGLEAGFDPQTGEMTRLEQWDDFRYREGGRQGRADKAVFEPGKELITLEGRARVWDPTASTDADRILLDQKSGDFTAEGRVASTRLPDRKGAPSPMLATDQPMQATARRMTAANGNRLVDYEGDAVLWQGANRLQADRVRIDREKRRLEARGRVVSQFVDRPRTGGAAARIAKPVFTVVRAAELTYLDERRIAHYRGGAALVREGLDVRAKEILAHLREGNSDSSLEKAFAEGGVRIVQSAAGRTRTGTAEHAEYYQEEEKVVLHGGQPQMVDSLKGSTRGRRLTYFANSERLIVDGGTDTPAVSRLKRK